MASSAVPSGYCPTVRSPSSVRTKTVPVSSTRPQGCCTESVTASPVVVGCRPRRRTGTSLLHGGARGTVVVRAVPRPGLLEREGVDGDRDDGSAIGGAVGDARVDH